MDPASQDLFGPESPELQPGRDSKTPELPPVLPFLRPLEAPPHVGFLLALCGLRRVREDDRGLEALWLRPDGEAASLLEGSVCRLLASFVKACEEPPPLGPGDLGLHACRAVAQATDLLCSQRPPSAQFRRLVESTLEALTEMLLHRDLFSQVRGPMGVSLRHPGSSPVRWWWRLLLHGGLGLARSSLASVCLSVSVRPDTCAHKAEEQAWAYTDGEGPRPGRGRRGCRTLLPFLSLGKNRAGPSSGLVICGSSGLRFPPERSL